MKPFIGIHATGDAEMYYIGPSIQAGSDLSLNQNFILSGYLHFFPRQIDRTYENGEFEKGSYRTFTAAILLEKKWRKRYDKGFFLAGGLAYQYLNDDFSAHFANWHRIRHILLPALRTGYSFPIGKHQLTAELNATGPSFYKLEDNGFTSNVTEILSQISIGTRFIF
ncbi:MAG: hypothetical protein H0U44_05350 [Flavisolibacter sp.]|jgi:hypothetical protein|nr:hypothetical protein [Flavisolibacter sp.]